MFHMLYSHNTLKKTALQNRKEETAMNSPRERSWICIFPAWDQRLESTGGILRATQSEGIGGASGSAA